MCGTMNFAPISHGYYTSLTREVRLLAQNPSLATILGGTLAKILGLALGARLKPNVVPD